VRAGRRLAPKPNDERPSRREREVATEAGCPCGTRSEARQPRFSPCTPFTSSRAGSSSATRRKPTGTHSGSSRSLHLFVEGNVQRAAQALPGLTSLLGIAYLTLHLVVTAGVLVWLHQRRPAAFSFARTTLLLASVLALLGFLVYPTAPPRLAGLGIADTVSNGHVDLNHGLVSSLYNPYAAVPSMHIGYALIVVTSLLRHGQHLLVRALGALYTPFVLLVIVATGNHFFFDAAAGAFVACLAATRSALITRPAATGRITALPAQCDPLRPLEELAA
jgi:hypothetical protein